MNIVVFFHIGRKMFPKIKIFIWFTARCHWPFWLDTMFFQSGYFFGGILGWRAMWRKIDSRLMSGHPGFIRALVRLCSPQKYFGWVSTHQKLDIVLIGYCYIRIISPQCILDNWEIKLFLCILPVLAILWIISNISSHYLKKFLIIIRVVIGSCLLIYYFATEI